MQRIKRRGKAVKSSAWTSRIGTLLIVLLVGLASYYMGVARLAELQVAGTVVAPESPPLEISAGPSGPTSVKLSNCATALQGGINLNGLLLRGSIGITTPCTVSIEEGRITITTENGQSYIELGQVQNPSPDTTFSSGNTCRGRSYIVQSGDTLSAIAGRNNTTTDAIQAENRLRDINTIQSGQKICLPK
jgi:LysM repeat protein